MYHCTIDLLFDWFGISCMTTDNFCFYMQNRIQYSLVKQTIQKVAQLLDHTDHKGSYTQIVGKNVTNFVAQLRHPGPTTTSLGLLGWHSTNRIGSILQRLTLSLLQISIGLSVFGFVANEYKWIAIQLLLTICNIQSAIRWAIKNVILNYSLLPRPRQVQQWLSRAVVTGIFAIMFAIDFVNGRESTVNRALGGSTYPG